MKIRKTSLPDEIYSQIKGSIKKGEWAPGDKLPSENELSESFGVNRLTVRMALQKLNALGIVETRVGEGTYVTDFSFSKYIGEISDFYLEPEMLENVCEFRKALEIECARCAVERASVEDLRKLETACDQYDAICERLFGQPELDTDILEELIEADLEFHHEIVNLSKNTLYRYSFEVARESIYRYLHMILVKRIEDTESHRELLIRACAHHRDIYNAITNGDFETCKDAISEMIDYDAKL